MMNNVIINNAEMLAEILVSMKELQKVVKDIKESTDKLAVDIAEIKESLYEKHKEVKIYEGECCYDF